MGIWLGPIGSGGVLDETDFSYTGQYKYQKSGGRFELAFLTSGTFISQKTIQADVCVVAGGQAGKAAGNSDGGASGAGGKGGQVKNYFSVTIQANTAYTVTIGASGENTSIETMVAVSGSGSDGGEAVTSGNEMVGNPGSPGNYAFDDANTLIWPGRKYGAGGGSGARNYCYGAGAGTWTSKEGGDGGETGAGKGGGKPNVGATSPTANTGSGGGGGGFNADYRNGASYTPTAASAGASGIAMIRG